MLRGASAEALVDLEQALGSTRTLADSATMGAELFEVGGLLRSEAALRRVATDSSVSSEAKVDLVRNVFASSVSDATLKVLVEAVQHRWISSHDLPAAVEHLAVVTTVRSGGKDAGRISDELFGVAQLIVANPELRSTLADRSRLPEDRARLLSGLLDGKVLPATAQLLERAVGSGRGSVEGVLADYQRIAAAAQDEMLAVVRTARELDEKDLERLATALGRQYSTTVHLQVVVDPELVGGMRIEIGDDRIDGTIAGRIDVARRRLVG